jgi:hypothetical protein
MASLEGWGSAIELHPRSAAESKRRTFRPFAESGRQDSNLRSSAPKADALAATLRPAVRPSRTFADECRTHHRDDQSSLAGTRPEERLAGSGSARRIAAAQREPSPDGLILVRRRNHRSIQRAQHRRAVEPHPGQDHR